MKIIGSYDLYSDNSAITRVDILESWDSIVEFPIELSLDTPPRSGEISIYEKGFSEFPGATWYLKMKFSDLERLKEGLKESIKNRIGEYSELKEDYILEETHLGPYRNKLEPGEVFIRHDKSGSIRNVSKGWKNVDSLVNEIVEGIETLNDF